MNGHEFTSLATAWRLNRETGALPVDRALAETIERLRRALIQIELTDGPPIQSKADLERRLEFAVTPEEWEVVEGLTNDPDAVA